MKYVTIAAALVNYIVSDPFEPTYTNVYQQNLSNPSVHQQNVITERLINSWLIVGKLGQGMRCCKCTNNSIYIGVCVTRDCVTILVSLILSVSI